MSLRNLQILAAITVLCVLAAIGLILSDQNAVISRIDARPAFPDLESRRADTANIIISGKGLETHLKQEANGSWKVVSSDGYPADQAAINRLISAMETLVLAEPRTKVPEKFQKLKLDTAKSGNGSVKIELKDREDSLISGIILGAMQAAPTPDRPGQFFVRLIGGDRAWLAEGRVISSPDPRSWLDQNLGLPADTDIQSIKVVPLDGPPYEMDRETADVSFVFRSLPDGRQLRSPSMPMQLAQSIAFLAIEDTRSRPGNLPGNASIVSYETFDGRRLQVRQWSEEEETWLAIDLQGNWSEPLKSRSTDYIFRISSARAKALIPTLESILIPQG